MIEPRALIGSPADLESLLARVERAKDVVPGLALPVASIGTGHAWTGPAARRYHSDTLAPLATALTAAKRQVTADVRATAAQAPSPSDPSHGHQPL